MRTWKYIGLALALVLINIPVQYLYFRVDMTDDHRYSLSEPTKTLLRELEEPVEVELLLDGKMNASFLRLREATMQLVEEMGEYGEVKLVKAEQYNLPATVIHERAKDGQTVQTQLYPYAVVRYGKKGSKDSRSQVVPLLVNERGRSGEENINRSIEQLEFTFAETVSSLKRPDKQWVAFLEGHGELPEENVLDVEMQLAHYYQVNRGTLTGDDKDLDGNTVLIIADPQEPFSERDKYQIDQYIMRGGHVLWLLNGVRFSEDFLETEGTTPIIPLDLHLQDLLFRYGARIEPALVQDMQCLPIPVDVSTDPSQPNFQPLPWTYAPLLLTSNASPVTAGLGQVSATFCSPVSAVGEDEAIRKEVLIATSTRSALTPTPAEVDLSNLNPNPERFVYQYVPVGVLLEGVFPSLYAHQMTPDGLDNVQPKRAQSEPTRQIVIGAGSVIRNELQQGQPLPCGYDRYTQQQFSNRDLIVNSVLYLTDEAGLIPLRQKTLTLRLLNGDKARANRTLIQLTTTLLPLLMLALVALIYNPLRKLKYQQPI